MVGEVGGGAGVKLARGDAMDKVKKHLFPVLCAGIAIIAIVVYFVPLGGWYDAFNQRLDAQAKAAGAITSLVNQKRVLPIVHPEQNQPEPLTNYPNNARLQQGLEQTARVQTAAQDVLARAVQINRAGHEVLLPLALPRPDPSSKNEFKIAYNNALRSNPTLPAPAGAATQPASAPAPIPRGNIPDGILNAAAPPTDAEIQAAWAREWETNYEPRLIFVGAPPAGGGAAAGQKPRAANERQLQTEMLEKNKDFRGKFRRDRANNFRTYIAPDALSVAPHMAPGETPSAEDIWFAQMALWVQQDAARAIAATNASYKGGILASPVKHVLRIDVPPGPGMYMMAADPTAPGGAAAGAEAAAIENVDAPITPLYERSPTGRISNALYDVVHFDLDVIVDAAHVRHFLQQLEHGRLITVLEMDMQAVDLKLAKERGYDYGDRPVARVSLKCEALYMRDWTARAMPGTTGTPPMPPEVMRLLGIQPTTPGAAPAVARGG